MDSVPLYNIFRHISFLQPTIGTIFAVILIVLLLVASGIISGSEIAFFGLSPADVAHLHPDKDPRDARIQKLRDDSERTLASILCANNFINVAIIILCGYVFKTLLDFDGIFLLQFAIETVLLTFLLLLFSEVMPKIYARQLPADYCRRWVNTVFNIRKMVWPLASFLLKGGTIAEKIIRQNSPALSVDDLEQALELTDKNTIQVEQNILQGIIRFGDEDVKDVMTMRQDIADIDIRMPFDEVLRFIAENNYSRIPVTQDSTDNIRGILYIKDLLPHLSEGRSYRWQKLVHPTYFVPETKKLDDLLREFQKKRVHIAIVVDEYGGTSGLITLEDIMEEIVGEIQDEYDEEEKTYTMLNTNTYIFEGKTLLSDFYKVIHAARGLFDDIEGDADTIAGILLELKGDFPKLHEKVDYRNFTFEVIEIEGHRISKVKIVVHKRV